jgi:hypothetical protein
VLGAFIGVGAAHLMFGEAFIQVSDHVRTGGGQLLVNSLQRSVCCA